ncbi:MAG: hypothetical protein IPK50_21985 [Fibrobacterota bacterium]|nr:MAG: hypothetical protein IPK50_21985 [Fibrobacterota bacterium]
MADSTTMPKAFAGGLLLAILTGFGHAALQVPASDPLASWQARTLGPQTGYRDVGWSASRVSLRFSGTGLRARIDTGRTWWNLTLDGQPTVALRPSRSDTLVLASGLAEGIHEVTLAKRTELFVGSARIHEFLIEGANPRLHQTTPGPSLGIEFVGNSITCGYGVHAPDPGGGFQDSTEDAEATAYARAARALGAEFRVACYSGYGVYRDLRSQPNTLPGIYDLADPNQSGVWDHSKWHPDIVVVNLGTNDYARGIPDSAAFSNAYAEFLSHLVQVHPGVAIALVHGPMIADGFPPDSAGNPQPSATSLKNRISALAKSATVRLGVPVDTIVLTPQSQSVGWGGDYHPNLEQSRINGLELEAGLRRAFPKVIEKAVSGREPVRTRPGTWSWQGRGTWNLSVHDLKGGLVTRRTGVGSGSLEGLDLPRGLHLAFLVQDGTIRTIRFLSPD